MLLNCTAHLGQVPRQPVASPDSAPVVRSNPGASTNRGLSGTAPLPQCYEGEPNLCRGFLNQVGIFLEMVPHVFPSDRSKVGFIISLLSGRALAWANPLWETGRPIVANYTKFVDEFHRVFDVSATAVSAAKQLMTIRQGARTVADYTIEFHTLAAEGRVLLFTMCAAGIGGTFQYGYNLTIINAPTMHIQKFVNLTWLERSGSQLESQIITLIWSIIVSVYPLGGFLGALLAGPMAIRLGRKKSLLFNNLFIILSAILCGFSRMARSFEMIVLGRVLAGVNSGISMNIQPMYLGESAPKNLRGTVALSSAVFTASGLVLGQVVGLREILGSEEYWPLLLASNVVPGILQLMALPWLPESPRYLLIDLKDKDSCVSALQRFRGHCDLSTEMDEMLAEQDAIRGQKPKSLCELIREPTLRWQLLTIVVLSSAMQLCGNDAMYFYSSYIFQEAGIPAEKIQYYVIGTGSCELITSITCTVFIDRVGRRALVTGGYGLMSIWAVVFMVALSQQGQVYWIPYLSMVCIFAYILSFGIGPAGVTGIMPAEIFDQMARPAAYMICGSLIWIMLFVVGLAFPFIVQGLGHFCFIPFLVVCVSTAVYIGVFLPETKGKSLLEITAEFQKRSVKPQNEANGYCGPQEIKSTMLDFDLPTFLSFLQDGVDKELTLNLSLLALVLGIGGTFQYGLHISIINSPSQHIQKFINSTWQDRYGSTLQSNTAMLLWSFIVSVYSIGGLLGSLAVGHLSVKFGRKKIQLYNNVLVLFGAVLMSLSQCAQSFEMIILARFLYGINAGVSLNLHTMYIGECAPQRLRGMITVTVSFFIAFGKLIGFLVGLRELLGTETLWPYLMSVSAVPALIQLLTLPFFPESPRFLLIDKGDKDGCLKAMQQLWGPGEHKSEMNAMLAEKNSIVGERVKGVKDLLRDRLVRWQMISLILLCGALQLVGINAVYFYAYDVFHNAGIPTSQTPYVSMGVGFTELLTTVLCGSLIDRIGRKVLLWVNYGIMALILALLTVTLSLQNLYYWLPYISSMLIFIYTLSFGMGPGGVSCVLPTEMFIQSYRPAAYVLTGTLNWLGLFVLALAFPFIEASLGTFCFIFFLVYCFFLAAFAFLMLPETKDRTILEILESFSKLNYKEKKTKPVCATKL
ncbi:uncharacterized protein WCC33_003115 [Rhinophrynus dorsalis]